MGTRSHNFGPGEEVTTPSSPGQLTFMGMLAVELTTIGVPDACITHLGDHSILVDIPATPGFEDAKRMCLAGHVDTYYGMPGDAKPTIHDYAGGDIKLPFNDVVIPADHLAGLEGKHIITSDGTTLLGGDDKAGVASLVTLIEALLTGAYTHGPVMIWFCVDEEIGQLGIEHLPKELAESFGMFLTVDGTRLGNLSVGCFHCRQVMLTFRGQDAHPGEYPKLLKASHYAALRFIQRMTAMYPSPWDGIKDKTRSFFYVTNIEGNPSQTVLMLAPRAFEAEVSDEMTATLLRIAEEEAARGGLHARGDQEPPGLHQQRAVHDPRGAGDPPRCARGSWRDGDGSHGQGRHRWCHVQQHLPEGPHAEHGVRWRQPPWPPGVRGDRGVGEGARHPARRAEEVRVREGRTEGRRGGRDRGLMKQKFCWTARPAHAGRAEIITITYKCSFYYYICAKQISLFP
ncbi:MAG: hypothetical protein V1907_01655 [Candidatus Kerfeldbacteria bacterium]